MAVKTHTRIEVNLGKQNEASVKGREAGIIFSNEFTLNPSMTKLRREDSGYYFVSMDSGEEGDDLGVKVVIAKLDENIPRIDRQENYRGNCCFTSLVTDVTNQHSTYSPIFLGGIRWELSKDNRQVILPAIMDYGFFMEDSSGNIVRDVPPEITVSFRRVAGYVDHIPFAYFAGVKNV